jgi:hypothetical protein
VTGWIRKIVLFLALAVMPLQAAVNTLAFLLCHGEAPAHEMHAQHDHDHGAGQSPDHGHDSGPEGSTLYHLCCKLVAFAPSLGVTPAAQPEFPVQAFALDSLRDLFFPDQPQRPPLV